MRKIITILIMLIAAAFTASAEEVWYQVKYENEYHNVQKVTYVVNPELTEEDFNILFELFNAMVIDKDADAIDLAIVNKLDKQGYKGAARDNQIVYAKKDSIWYRFEEK